MTAPLKLKKSPSPLERDEQSAFFAWVKYIRYKGESILEDCYAVPNGSFLAGDAAQRAIQGKALQRQGVKAGHPDINVDLPVAQYHGLRIEMKRVDGRAPTPEQETALKRLERRGFKTAVAYGFEEAQAALNAYLALDP